jgi:hypothetical protein
MAFPARCLFTILEASGRWTCSPTQIVDWAISDEIELVAGFAQVMLGDEIAAGMLIVRGTEVRPLFRPFGNAAKKVYIKQARRPGRSVWLTITEPVKGAKFTAADIMITADEIERFEQAHEINRTRSAGPGAPGKYDWDGFHIAVMKRIHNHGLPATQTALIVEMQEWFIANSTHGSAPDESTIRQRIKVIWHALKAA